MDVLLELSTRAVAILAIPHEVAGVSTPLVVVLPTKLVLINTENGAFVKTYDLPKGSNNTIVDAVYVSATKEFLIALSGGTIVSVTDVQTTIPLASSSWPCAPRKLHLFREKLIVVAVDGSVVITDIAATSPTSTSATSKAKYVDSVVIGNSIVVATEHRQEHIITTYTLPTNAGTTLLDIADGSSLSTIQDAPFVVQKLLSHPTLHCVSILSTQAAAKKSKKSVSTAQTSYWTKFDPITSDIHCTTPLSSPVTAAFTLLSSIYFVAASEIAVYDVKYALPTATLAGISSSALVTPFTTHETMLYYEHHAAASTCIARLVIPTPSITSLATIMGQNTVANTVDLSNGKILGGLASTSKRKLQSIAETPQPVPKEYLHINSRKYVNYTHLDIEDSIVSEFLSRFDASLNEPNVVIVNSDWDVLKVLLRGGRVRLSTYRNMFSVMLQSDRLDMLLLLAEYAIDMTENQMIALLLHVITLPNIESYSVINGSVEYSTAKANTSKTPKKKTKRSVVDHSSLLDVVRVFLEALMRRHGGVSAPLLCDALKSLSLSTAAVLLQLLTLMLRGYAKSSNDVLSQMYEVHHQRAMTWIECIIDTHFVSFLLHKSSVAETITSLNSIVNALDDGLKITQEAIGLWTHAVRNAKQGECGDLCCSVRIKAYKCNIANFPRLCGPVWWLKAQKHHKEWQSYSDGIEKKQHDKEYMMGSACAIEASAENDIIQYMMPPYFIPNVLLTDTHKRLVTTSWNAIMNEKTCPAYDQKGLMLFLSVFCARVEEIGQHSIAFAKNTSLPRHRMLIHLMSLIMHCVKDIDIISGVESFLMAYYDGGIRSYEIGILGEVLLHSMDITLADNCDLCTIMAWTCVYSRFLEIAMPLFVKYKRWRTSALICPKTM